MTIPKKIHYVWGYKEPKTKLALSCIASWVTVMPDYEIIEWNQDTIDFDELSAECPFFHHVYRLNLWAYMADYIRIKVLYQHGGIYLDTDVQVIRSLDKMRSHRFFAGFHDGYRYGKRTKEYVEAAVMGSVPNHPFLKDMITFFQKEMMHNNGHEFMPYVMNDVLEKYGLQKGDQDAHLQLREGIKIFPVSYFYPYPPGHEHSSLIDFWQSLSHPDMHTIHWFNGHYGKNVRHFLFIHYRRDFSYAMLLKRGGIRFYSDVKKALVLLWTTLFSRSIKP